MLFFLLSSQVNHHGAASNETYQERLARLEGDKESLILQVGPLWAGSSLFCSCRLRNCLRSGRRPEGFRRADLLLLKQSRSNWGHSVTLAWVLGGCE